MALDFIHGSIRKKIMYLVLLAVLPVFVVLLFNEIQSRHRAVQSAEHDTTIFLRGFSEVQRRITDSTRTLLRTISELPEIKAEDPTGAQRILSTLLKANPIYTNAILIDDKGDVVAMGRGKNKGFNFADRKQFKDAMRTREFAFGEFVIGKQSKKSIFPFAMPVQDEHGDPQGAIILGVNLSHYAELFDKAEFPEGSFFGLCDHKGTRIFRHPRPKIVQVGEPIKPEVFAVASGSIGAGTLKATTSEGLRRIVAYEPLRLKPGSDPYIYMFMALDESKVLASANEGLVRGAIVSVVSLCVALALAWMLSWKFIAAKIDRLAQSARELGQGCGVVASGLDYKDGEIGQLAESFDTMSNMLTKREEDLQTAKESAEAANRAKDEFLANISHEVRTPLNGVMGMLQLLRETRVNTEQVSFLDTALQSSKNLLRVLNDLLDFIKIGAGKLELYEEPFDLEELIKQSTNLFQLQITEKELALNWHVDSQARGAYSGDVGRLRQIIFNLLGNAIKFTHSGKIDIEVFVMPTKNKDRKQLFFTIEDTGVGIPDDKLEYIFDAFTQVDGSLSREYQGTGLGLPIVKNLVSLMSGNCIIESEVGVGTTVLFCVEVGKAEIQRNLVLSKDFPLEKRALNVLLVEDEMVNQIMAQRLLEKMGHTVTTASNGQECLELLPSKSFDIILMDIQMPVMDGLVATRVIRTAEKYREFSKIPILALSAHAADQSIEKALQVGVDEYVVKPFELENLERLILLLTGNFQS